MLETALGARNAPIDAINPRLRVVGALAFSVATALGGQPGPALFALAAGVCLAALARLPGSVLLRRLVPLNVMTLALFVLLPLSAEGEVFRAVGPFRMAWPGVVLAATVAIKANAILLALTALLSTVESVRLGHALQQLHVPQKLSHLFLFTVRYLDVMHREYARLHRAMRARGFVPRFGAHTLRTYGYLVGMLLVRAFERSERIAGAMKCRGFRGAYPAAVPERLTRADALFGVLMTLTVLLVVLGNAS